MNSLAHILYNIIHAKAKAHLILDSQYSSFAFGLYLNLMSIAMCSLVPSPIPSFSMLHVVHMLKEIGEPGDEAMLYA